MLFTLQVGEKGLGKTTFLQNLQAALQPDAPPAPTQHGSSSTAQELFQDMPELLCTQVVIQNGNVRCHYMLQV